MRTGVALGGFMGTGKTSVGRELARLSRLPFADTDALLHGRYGPVAEQFARDGEATFRRREREAVAALSRRGDQVVATGGGAWVDPANRDALRRRHHLVVLTASLDALAARLGDDPTRPLWDPAAAASLLASREAAYADADLHVDTLDRSPTAIARAILEALWPTA